MYTQLTLPQRQGLYLASDRVDAVQVGWDGVDYFGLYNTQTSQPLAPGAHVLCDIYRQSDIVLRDGNKIKVGAPILYYRANPSSRSIRITDPQVSGYDDLIYNFRDNTVLVQIRAINSKSDPRRPFLDGSPANNNALEFFYGSDTQVIGNPDTFGYIQDPTVTAQAWPYNPDTYILISAGQDGIYGTKDDIRNFGN